MRKALRAAIGLGVCIMLMATGLVWSAEAPKGAASAVKPVKPFSGMQEPLSFVRGTVTTNDGKGVKDVEVTLFLQESGATRPMPIDKKVTDSAGKYAISVSSDQKGKSFRIVPRLLQQCCQGCCAFSPGHKEFTFQGSITADFKLNLPAPDTSVSLVTMNPHVDNYADYYQTILYEFEVKNKGYLPTVKSALNLSFAQPCCPEDCTADKEVPVIPAQGSTKISITKKRISGARGCPFTATVSPQPNEVKTDDNKVTGSSPKVNATLIELTLDTNFVYIKNKGTSTPLVRLTWICNDKNCDGRCACPPLVPTSASGPSFPSIRNLDKKEAQSALAPNGTWVYPIPARLAQWGAEGGYLTQEVSAHIDPNQSTVYVNFK
ncbi:MAG: carboxypeptidase regulatory-like domain-containing protein [Nitrospirae bacterium]|nr:MAG: carboxypeptidase regulatory-like domain-containing protein [Nitrospirota bacterium]